MKQKDPSRLLPTLMLSFLATPGLLRDITL